jgi:hypothetical protein
MLLLLWIELLVPAAVLFLRPDFMFLFFVLIPTFQSVFPCDIHPYCHPDSTSPSSLFSFTWFAEPPWSCFRMVHLTSSTVIGESSISNISCGFYKSMSITFSFFFSFLEVVF